mmetsp:Transcript_14007/g.29563  ORF Transcript_14007/g.29563 Transcript_14007/m.29563 type:complete len:432 (+) Transcript_14007:238-1533(+)
MAGGHIDLDAARTGGCRIGLVPDFCRKLRWFPVLHPRIVKTTGQQARRIFCSLLHIVNGGVFHHVLVVFFLVGIPPFLPFDDRQRNGGIDHGGNNVHKRHSQESCFEKFGILVHGSPDQQSSGRSSLATELFGSGDFSILRQPSSHVYKIVKGVLLAKILGPLGFFVPLPTHFATPSHVGNDIDHSSVQEGPASRPEGCLHAGAVGSVSVQMSRNRLAVLHLFHDIGSIDNADGDFGFSIAGCHGDSLAGILGLVVPGYLLFFQDGPCFRIGRSIQRDSNVAQGCHERIVGHHHGIGGAIEVRSEAYVEGILVEFELNKVFDVNRVFPVVCNDPDLGQSTLTSRGHRMRLKGGDSRDGSVVSAIKQLLTVSIFQILPLFFRFGHRFAHHKFHVGRPSHISVDVPVSGTVTNIVQYFFSALGHALEFGIGVL